MSSPSLTRTLSPPKIPTVGFEEKQEQKQENAKTGKIDDQTEKRILAMLDKVVDNFAENPAINEQFQKLQKSAQKIFVININPHYIRLTSLNLAVAVSLADRWAEKMIREKEFLAIDGLSQEQALRICHLASVNLILQSFNQDKLCPLSESIGCISHSWFLDSLKAYKERYKECKVAYIA
jgi:hypothetical protein